MHSPCLFDSLTVSILAELDVPSPQIVKKGQTIELSCSFELRNHQRVDFWADHEMDQKRTQLSVHNRLDAVVATLTVHNSTRTDDEGEYICQAKSELVTQTGRITLLVEGKMFWM